MNKTHRVMFGVLMALLLLAAGVMWQNGELDAKAGVILFAFAILGVGLLLPRAYMYLCIGLFLALSAPLYALLSGRVMSLRGRRQPDVLLQADEATFWVFVVAWLAISIAVCVFGILRIARYKRALKARRRDA